MSAATPLPVALPVTMGSREQGFNVNVLYDAHNDSIGTLFGLPQSTSREELAKAVEARDFNGAWVDGAARADYIVRAINAFPVLVQALQMAKEFEQHAGGTHMPPGSWFKLHEALDAALATAGAAP